MNDSERLVYDVCQKSFLSLWSYANPLRLDGKELCDVLIVCDPDILVLSVKDIALKDSGRPDIDHARWQRKAIDGSVRQLDGAVQELARLEHVIRSDGSRGFPLPPQNERRIHRIAIALGSRGQAQIVGGEIGKGHIHVFSDTSWRIVLEELDTITDFVQYLKAKEDLTARGTAITAVGGEEDLLTVYLSRGGSFPDAHRLIHIEEPMWGRWKEEPWWKAKKAADNVSYFWDQLIEFLSKHVGHNPVGPPYDLNLAESAIRRMARETRFGRRFLSVAFAEWHRSIRSRSRYLLAPSGVGYVFQATPRSEDRAERIAELKLRCFVVRNLLNVENVVGIATEEYEANGGVSFDVAAIQAPEWTEDNTREAERIQEEFGFYQGSKPREVYMSMYPEPRTRQQRRRIARQHRQDSDSQPDTSDDEK